MMMYMPVFSHLRTDTPLPWRHRTELVATEKELHVTGQLTCMISIQKVINSLKFKNNLDHSAYIETILLFYAQMVQDVWN